jgi:pyruvate formate lyase activating enzyme
MIDFPGHLAAVVFLQGCPWQCLYCQNPHLQKEKSAESLSSWEEVETFLATRKGKLDGVIFSGGEPLLTPQIRALAERVHALGFLVALHTGGAFPERLLDLLPLLNWVGFDVKVPFSEYAAITQVPNSGLLAEQSLDLLINSNIPFEVRTTAHPNFLSQEKLWMLVQELIQKGVEIFALQRARDLKGDYLPGFYDPSFVDTLRPLFKHFILR